MMPEDIVGVVLIFLLVSSFHVVTAVTDLRDVEGLQSLYQAFNQSIELKWWVLEGGDPCSDYWKGVSCQGIHVKTIILSGLGLRGEIATELYALKNLEYLDLSFNQIHGDIPQTLPAKIIHLNLANNMFSQNIPNSLYYLRYLRYLNLSNNQLSGVLGDIYDGLINLREMDLSFNLFTGEVPRSFGRMPRLSTLYLQGNAFTGVLYVDSVQLSQMNLEGSNLSTAPALCSPLLSKEISLTPSSSFKDNYTSPNTSSQSIIGSPPTNPWLHFVQKINPVKAILHVLVAFCVPAVVGLIGHKVLQKFGVQRGRNTIIGLVGFAGFYGSLWLIFYCEDEEELSKLLNLASTIVVACWALVKIIDK